MTRMCGKTKKNDKSLAVCKQFEKKNFVRANWTRNILKSTSRLLKLELPVLSCPNCSFNFQSCRINIWMIDTCVKWLFNLSRQAFFRAKPGEFIQFRLIEWSRSHLQQLGSRWVKNFKCSENGRGSELVAQAASGVCVSLKWSRVQGRHWHHPLELSRLKPFGLTLKAIASEISSNWLPSNKLKVRRRQALVRTVKTAKGKARP